MRIPTKFSILGPAYNEQCLVRETVPTLFIAVGNLTVQLILLRLYWASDMGSTFLINPEITGRKQLYLRSGPTDSVGGASISKRCFPRKQVADLAEGAGFQPEKFPEFNRVGVADW